MKVVYGSHFSNRSMYVTKMCLNQYNFSFPKFCLFTACVGYKLKTCLQK